MGTKCFKILLILIVIISTSFSSVHAVEDNTLYFDEKNGELYYESSGQSINHFIINENMIPGTAYVNTLNVVNESEYDFDLSLNMIPKDTFMEMEEEFLKMIKMNIYFDQKLVYNGDALGFSEGILLGSMHSLKSHVLRVETILEMDTKVVKDEGYYVKSAYMAYKEGGLKPFAYTSQEAAKDAALKNGENEIIYASLGYLTSDEGADISMMMAETTWQFYAQRNHEDTPKKEDIPKEEVKPSPETGDSTNVNLYLGFMGIAGMFIVYRVFIKQRSS